MVFTVSASTPFVMLPSNEDTPTNIVSIIPKTHITVLFINFDSLSICTLSDMFEIMLNAIDISVAGISMVFIKLPINVITNSIIGCNIVAETVFPVVIMSVIKSGNKLFINPTKSVIELFTITIMSEKFFIITVTISIYVT